MTTITRNVSYKILEEHLEKAQKIIDDMRKEITARKEAIAEKDKFAEGERPKLRKVKSIYTYLTFNTGESKQNNIEIYYYSDTDTLEFRVEGTINPYNVSSRKNKYIMLLRQHKDDSPFGVKVLDITRRSLLEWREIAQEVAEFLGADAEEIEAAMECAMGWETYVSGNRANGLKLLR